MNAEVTTRSGGASSVFRLLAFFAIVTSLRANAYLNPNLPVEMDLVDSTGELVATIRRNQGVASNSDINADKVSEMVLVELGRLVMGDKLGSNPVYVWLDTMVGGEASQTLREVRRQVGYNYLRGRTGRFPGFAHSPLDEQARIGAELQAQEASRHGAPTRTTLMVEASVAAQFIIILLLLLQVLKIRRQGAVRGALDVLEKRFARGEISTTEFEEKKAVLVKPPKRRET